MATSAEPLLDTSVAIPFLLRGHAAHASTYAVLRDRPLGLSGHAAFETVSVLTRIPEPARVSPGLAVRLLHHNFPNSRFLSEESAASLLPRLADAGIGGGAVYDALVAAAALEHGCTLVTRDRRALPTYEAMGVAVEILT